MIERDRELLARASLVNQQLGAATVEMLHRQNGGELPANGLRTVGEHLAQLAADLIARAEELDGRTTEPAVVIDQGEQPR
ncbi:MAG: hypothetical protein GEU98_07770 [Pseudonocardiaceae bacterium]|nr:hypothetical protein [Pseudonocardiaceae bacterium]